MPFVITREYERRVCAAAVYVALKLQHIRYLIDASNGSGDRMPGVNLMFMEHCEDIMTGMVVLIEREESESDYSLSPSTESTRMPFSDEDDVQADPSSPSPDPPWY